MFMVSLFISSSLLIHLTIPSFLAPPPGEVTESTHENPSHSEESYHIGTEEDMRLR